ncbi:hypothetical protein JHW43_002288 [Diplocarpon mali]|nr:hypothetical protein JHW43_002288 [Diplocarpon mali]
MLTRCLVGTLFTRDCEWRASAVLRMRTPPRNALNDFARGISQTRGRGRGVAGETFPLVALPLPGRTACRTVSVLTTPVLARVPAPSGMNTDDAEIVRWEMGWQHGDRTDARLGDSSAYTNGSVQPVNIESTGGSIIGSGIIFTAELRGKYRPVGRTRIYLLPRRNEAQIYSCRPAFGEPQVDPLSTFHSSIEALAWCRSHGQRVLVRLKLESQAKVQGGDRETKPLITIKEPETWIPKAEIHIRIPFRACRPPCVPPTTNP